MRFRFGVLNPLKEITYGCHAMSNKHLKQIPIEYNEAQTQMYLDNKIV
jgi:hypothetical protein